MMLTNWLSITSSRKPPVVLAEGFLLQNFVEGKKTHFAIASGLWTVVIVRGRRGVSSRLGSLLHGGPVAR